MYNRKLLHRTVDLDKVGNKSSNTGVFNQNGEATPTLFVPKAWLSQDRIPKDRRLRSGIQPCTRKQYYHSAKSLNLYHTQPSPQLTSPVHAASSLSVSASSVASLFVFSPTLKNT